MPLPLRYGGTTTCVSLLRKSALLRAFSKPRVSFRELHLPLTLNPNPNPNPNPNGGPLADAAEVLRSSGVVGIPQAAPVGLLREVRAEVEAHFRRS